MNTMKLALPLLIALAYAPAQVLAATPLLGDLNQLSVFAGTVAVPQGSYLGIGDSAIVYGSIFATGVLTTGAGAKVTGNVVSGGAANIGAIIGTPVNPAAYSVGGYVESGGVLTTGDGAIVKGYVNSTGAATIGRNATVLGNMISGGVATTGANSTVGGSLVSSGAATIGDTAFVGGNMKSGNFSTTGANSTVMGTVTGTNPNSISASSHVVNGASTTPTTAPILTSDVIAKAHAGAAQVLSAQTALTNMDNSGAAIMGFDTLGTVITSHLDATMTVDTTLYAGVFSAASWSTTATRVLTLDNRGLDNQSWVFNFADILAFGGDTTIRLVGGGTGSEVIWNVGNGYASLGDGADVIGTILAKTYVMVGANATVTGIGDSCGGIYSQTSYVSTGANSIVGGTGCTGVNSSFVIGDDGKAFRSTVISAVPEPETYGMLLAGLGLLGFMARRKNQAQKQA